MLYYVYLTTLQERYKTAVNAKPMLYQWAQDGGFKYAIFYHNFLSAN